MFLNIGFSLFFLVSFRQKFTVFRYFCDLMFTGIIEEAGEVLLLERTNQNLILAMKCGFRDEIRIDQSISHNGVCLTVDGLRPDSYLVTIIHETLSRTNLGALKVGDSVNLERSLRLGDRLEGHLVQGHVDCTARVEQITEMGGSWEFHFTYEPNPHITVAKGSVCVNGVSLTVVESGIGQFSVAVIPYTFQHTNFRNLRKGDLVNIEFDIIGKYIAGLEKLRI
jgi:riboflavin synthase